LGKIHWLHLTPDRMKWPERLFKRHGDKTVFIARFIFLFPPVVVNLLAGMSTMPWRSFLFYDLTGSAAYATTYTLIGYFFGKKWKLIEAWLGPTALYLILAGIALIVLDVIFRKSISEFLARLFSKNRQRK
jgi:membrane protein DedA with SNARE-associated domain